MFGSFEVEPISQIWEDDESEVTVYEQRVFVPTFARPMLLMALNKVAEDRKVKIISDNLVECIEKRT